MTKTKEPDDPNEIMGNVLSKLSGKSIEECRKIAEQVRGNLKLLDSCAKPHEFVPFEVTGKFARTCRCLKCGGVVRIDLARWYMRGLSDAAASSGTKTE